MVYNCSKEKVKPQKNVAFFFDLNFKYTYSLITFIFGLHVALIPIIHHCEFKVGTNSRSRVISVNV